MASWSGPLIFKLGWTTFSWFHFIIFLEENQNCNKTNINLFILIFCVFAPISYFFAKIISHLSFLNIVSYLQFMNMTYYITLYLVVCLRTLFRTYHFPFVSLKFMNKVLISLVINTISGLKCIGYSLFLFHILIHSLSFVASFVGFLPFRTAVDLSVLPFHCF